MYERRMKISVALILQFVTSIAGQFCPGERVSSFSCTTEISHVWSGSALDGRCPTASPSDGIVLSSALNVGDTVPCGIFTANITNIAIVMGDTLLSSTISFTASSDLDGTEVVCTDSTMTEVESYSIMVVGQFCPGERVSSFSCTTEIVHVWSGSALAGQCPSSIPSDGIGLSTAANPEGGNDTCGIFTATVTGIVGGMLSSTISFTASSNLDGTEIVCTDGTMIEVESYSIFIIGPPTAPDNIMVDFTMPRVAFVITWDGTAVVSNSDVTGFQVNSPSCITCDDTSSNPSAMESRCTWEPSAVGQTHSICVSEINCGSQQGGSECISVNLQVPEAPILTVCPVYDQSGDLLRIETSSTIVPAVDIADGVDGSPDAYIFYYNDTTQEIGSILCVNGPCTGTFIPPSSVVGPYTVSVTARNVVGEGPADTSGPISDTNDRLISIVDVDQKRLVCVLLAGFMGSGTTECQIMYGTNDSYSDLPFMDTGSNTGTTITVALTATLQPRTTYYYIVTATSGNVCARQRGSFTTECVPDGLVEEGSSVDIVDEGCGLGDSGVLTSAGTGRACYSGTTEGSVATYACNCPSLYKIVGAGTRTCQSDGTWSGSVPQCLPECASVPEPPLSGSNEPTVTCSSTSSLISAEYGCSSTNFNITICHWPEAPSCAAGLSVGAAVGITFALTFLVSFSAGLLVAFVIAYCYNRRQKGQYSPRDTQQPTITQAAIPLQQGSIELKDNISYGPVTSQHPAPQQPATMYEEVATHVQPGSMEMRANVAYGPITH